MEEKFLPENEKTEHEEDGENSEDYKNEEVKQSLNSSKILKEEKNKNTIIQNNESLIKEEKGSKIKEENKNKIIEEDKLSKDETNGYEGDYDDDEYDIKYIKKGLDKLSIKARKDSDKCVCGKYNPLKIFFNLSMPDKIIYQEKYIINSGERLTRNVIKGKNKETNKELIFKIEDISHKNLLNEAKILNDLIDIERVPKMETIDIYDYHYILVMNYIGPSLQDCLEKCNGKFSLGTTLKISIQILDILKQIHDKGIALRYLKPENMLIGTGENKDFVYLIDFDLATKIIVDGEHIKYGKAEHIRGNKNFISLNLHNYIEATRRDDIESLGYNLIYFMKGTFPWKKCSLEDTKEKKIYIPLEELCSGLPDEFKEFIEYGRKLEFSEKPDYEYLKNLLLKSAKKNNIDIYSVKYDWEIINEENEKIINEMKLQDVKVLNGNDFNKNNNKEEIKEEFYKNKQVGMVKEQQIKNNNKDEKNLGNEEQIKDEKNEENSKKEELKRNEYLDTIKNKLKYYKKIYRDIPYLLLIITYLIIFILIIIYLFFK